MVEDHRPESDTSKGGRVTTNDERLAPPVVRVECRVHRDASGAAYQLDLGHTAAQTNMRGDRVENGYVLTVGMLAANPELARIVYAVVGDAAAPPVPVSPWPEVTEAIRRAKAPPRKRDKLPDGYTIEALEPGSGFMYRLGYRWKLTGPDGYSLHTPKRAQGVRDAWDHFNGIDRKD